MMLMAGLRPAFCAKQLGHSVKVFLETYAKWIDGQHDELEMCRLEQHLAPDSVPEVSPAPAARLPRRPKTGRKPA